MLSGLEAFINLSCKKAETAQLPHSILQALRRLIAPTLWVFSAPVRPLHIEPGIGTGIHQLHRGGVYR